MGVYAGLIDTDMSAAFSGGSKTPPGQVARKAIEGIRGRLDQVLADERAENLWRAGRQDLAEMHARWDQHLAA
jgi:hypothetical protein